LEDSALKVATLPYSAFHSNAAAGAMATRSPKTDILMIKDVAEYLKVTERTSRIDWNGPGHEWGVQAHR
jgi:hypothetical protein